MWYKLLKPSRDVHKYESENLHSNNSDMMLAVIIHSKQLIVEKKLFRILSIAKVGYWIILYMLMYPKLLR